MGSVAHYRCDDVLVNLHARLGEGPRWDHRHGVLAWVDILGGHVHQTEPATGTTTSIQVGADIGALALLGDDGYLLAIRNGFASLVGDNLGEIQEVFSYQNLRMNDAVVDPAGRFVAGSMARDGTPGKGSLYSRERDGSVRPLFDGVTISNDLAWSAEGGQMFYVDSGLRGIDVMEYDVATGDVANRRRWVDVPQTEGTPDGITIDADGCIWVALWGGGKVLRYSPSGQVIGEVILPVRQVSACGFGGPNLDRLYITTASVGLDDPPGPLDGAVFVVDVDCHGVESMVAGGAV